MRDEREICRTPWMSTAMFHSLLVLGLCVPLSRAADATPAAPEPRVLVARKLDGDGRSVVPSPAWTGESDQAAAQFGAVVMTAGDVNGDGFSDLIVGAPEYDSGEGNEGRAYLYLGSASGLAASPAWIFDGTQAGGRVGAAVGAAGDANGDGFDDVIVGAPGMSNGEIGEGVAFLFLGSASGLSATARWKAEGDQAGAGFGSTVAAAGDVNGDGFADFVVGAELFDGVSVDEGRVSLYLGSPLCPDSVPVWSAFGAQAGAHFGHAVATAGDVNADGFSDLIVGAPTHDSGVADAGRVVLFAGSTSGLGVAPVWSLIGVQSMERCGDAVVTAGDVNGDGFSDLLIGAPGYAQSGTDEGRACVFHGSASWPATAPAWVSVGGQVGAGYGSSVGPAGDVNGDGYADVIVGAPEYDETYVDGGRAVVYQGGAAGLATSPTWSLFAAQAAARFGCAVATAGDVNGDGLSDVVVGARGYDHGQADEGWAGAYFGATDLLAVAPDWTAICDQANASFGISVASAGDVNGDGYSDMIVGADMYDAPDLCNGRAYLYLGGPDGLATNPSWVVDGPQYFAFLGVSVASAGDVNGDGYSDVVVGVYRATDTQPEEGLAYLYLGSPQGLSTEPAWIGKSGQAGAWYGYTIAGAGDVNGDGYADVITGAADYDTSAPDGGRVYVYYGSPMGLPAEPSWKIDCSQAYAKLGVWVSGAGDVNGDGYSDVLASAYQYDNGQTDEGRVYLYLGSATGLMATPAWTTEGNQAYCQYGYPANSAGDVNGDGYSDVIVGAPWYDSPGLDGGKVYLYLGGPAGLSTTPDWTATSGQTMARFGITACSAGDVNHDGRSDVLVGAQFYDAGQQDEGRAFLYLGSASGLSPTAAWTTESNQVDGYLGYAGATAGDVNGDGFSDLAVSTYYYDNGSLVDAGRVDLFYGNARTGLRRLPRQMCVNGWEPIVPLGRSDAETGFRLQATGRTPLGRGRVRLQYEVKPAGVPFNGAGLITGPPVWTAEPVEDGSEAQLAEIVGNLSTFSLYHWRLRTLTDSPFFPRSPWFWQPYNSVTEADVRTALIGSAVPDGPLVEATPVLGGFPNPFAAATRLSYSLDGAARVRLEVYDASGRAVACMVDRDEAAGSHSVLWDGRDAQGRAAPNGVYFVRIEAGGHAAVQKVVVRR